MAVNRDKPDLWKSDIASSVDLYNAWFIEFAPVAFRETRVRTTQEVEATLQASNNLREIRPGLLRNSPHVLPTLRMCTCPPLARDRLIGLANVPKSMIDRMEKKQRLPARMSSSQIDTELQKVASVIQKLADRDILPWLERGSPPSRAEIYRAATIVADRLCGATADPIIRNAQEARQLQKLSEWLDVRGYRKLSPGQGTRFTDLPPGTYAFRLNVPVRLDDQGIRMINIPVDAVVMRKTASQGDLPLLIEAKSAGDFTNVNKRRKEEAKKIDQLRRSYGDKVAYVLLLCGYFDSGYLGYEAAEGIDWVWEHRIDDLQELGV